MVTTRPPKTIVKPTALGPVANTDTKLLIYGLFQKGRVLAQDGIKAMAERGLKTSLNEEIRAARDEGTADRLLSGDGIPRSPSSVSLDFAIRRDYTLVTLVLMVAPSPDWFTGVSALSFLEGGQWVEELTVELFAYDAGTDSGTTYNSANDPTSPRESIQRIDGRPLAVGGQVAPVGTFTFTRR